MTSSCKADWNSSAKHLIESTTHRDTYLISYFCWNVPWSTCHVSVHRCCAMWIDLAISDTNWMIRKREPLKKGNSYHFWNKYSTAWMGRDKTGGVCSVYETPPNCTSWGPMGLDARYCVTVQVLQQCVFFTYETSALNNLFCGICSYPSWTNNTT